MQTSFGKSALAAVQSWFTRVWRLFASSVGDPVDRLVGPSPWDERERGPRVMRN